MSELERQEIHQEHHEFVIETSTHPTWPRPNSNVIESNGVNHENDLDHEETENEVVTITEQVSISTVKVKLSNGNEEEDREEVYEVKTSDQSNLDDVFQTLESLEPVGDSDELTQNGIGEDQSHGTKEENVNIVKDQESLDDAVSDNTESPSRPARPAEEIVEAPIEVEFKTDKIEIHDEEMPQKGKAAGKEQLEKKSLKPSLTKRRVVHAEEEPSKGLASSAKAKLQSKAAQHHKGSPRQRLGSGKSMEAEEEPSKGYASRTKAKFEAKAAQHKVETTPGRKHAPHPRTTHSAHDRKPHDAKSAGATHGVHGSKVSIPHSTGNVADKRAAFSGKGRALTVASTSGDNKRKEFIKKRTLSLEAEAKDAPAAKPASPRKRTGSASAKSPTDSKQRQ